MRTSVRHSYAHPAALQYLWRLERHTIQSTGVCSRQQPSLTAPSTWPPGHTGAQSNTHTPCVVWATNYALVVFSHLANALQIGFGEDGRATLRGEHEDVVAPLRP